MTMATAPYNFVPLPDQLVQAEQPPPGDRYHDDLWTGEIDLTLENLTPLMLGGLDAENGVVSSFQPAVGQPRIPGSALRGAISSLFEIVTWSRPRFVGDDLLFYRKVADRRQGDPIVLAYRASLSEGNVRAGWVKRDRGSTYSIRDAREVAGRQYFRVAKKQDKQTWKRQVGWILESDIDGDKVSHVYPDEIEANRHGSTPIRGMLVRPGPMQGANHNWFILEPEPQAERLTLPEEFVEKYGDLNGGETPEVARRSFSILQEEIQDGTPAFYIRRSGGERELIIAGHTRYFRVPYERRMREALPDELSGKEIDLTDAVFGYVDRPESRPRSLRSRVFFEDAKLQGEPRFEAAAKPQALYSPRPTSYQHYLEQDDRRDLVSWNGSVDGTPPRLRGAKMFWHRRTGNWQATDQAGTTGSDREPIRPLTAGQAFHGRIRFENLRAYELGALLFALDLPPDCAHKLGFGKPIGLGSVRIEVTGVTRSKRLSRYTAFLDDAGEGLLSGSEPADKEALKTAFANWLLDQLGRAHGDSSQEVLWEIDRMQELRAMLSWDSAPPTDATKYMDFNDYRRRDVLPKPTEVKAGRQVRRSAQPRRSSGGGSQQSGQRGGGRRDGARRQGHSPRSSGMSPGTTADGALGQGRPRETKDDPSVDPPARSGGRGLAGGAPYPSARGGRNQGRLRININYNAEVVEIEPDWIRVSLVGRSEIVQVSRRRDLPFMYQDGQFSIGQRVKVRIRRIDGDQIQGELRP